MLLFTLQIQQRLHCYTAQCCGIILCCSETRKYSLKLSMKCSNLKIKALNKSKTPQDTPQLIKCLLGEKKEELKKKKIEHLWPQWNLALPTNPPAERWRNHGMSRSLTCPYARSPPTVCTQHLAPYEQPGSEPCHKHHLLQCWRGMYRPQEAQGR